MATQDQKLVIVTGTLVVAAITTFAVFGVGSSSSPAAATHLDGTAFDIATPLVAPGAQATASADMPPDWHLTKQIALTRDAVGHFDVISIDTVPVIDGDMRIRIVVENTSDRPLRFTADVGYVLVGSGGTP